MSSSSSRAGGCSSWQHPCFQWPAGQLQGLPAAVAAANSANWPRGVRVSCHEGRRQMELFGSIRCVAVQDFRPTPRFPPVRNRDNVLSTVLCVR